MLLKFRFLINVGISIHRSGLEQDVCKETNVTNRLLILKICPYCGCLVPVSSPCSQCNEEEQRHRGLSLSPPLRVSLSYQTGASPVIPSVGDEEFCWHWGTAGRWVFLALLQMKPWSILFSLASGLHCCSQRYLEASGPRCQGKKRTNRNWQKQS